MAKRATTSSAAFTTGQSDDEAPEVIEQSAAAAEAREAEPVAKQADEPEREQPDEKPTLADAAHQARADAVQRMRDKRDSEKAKSDEDEPPEAQADADEEPEGEAEPKKAEPVAKKDEPEARKITLKVDHQDRVLTEEEVYSAARQHLAAENRLQELNRMRAEFQAGLAELRTPQHTTPVQQAPQPADQVTPEQQRSPAQTLLDPARAKDALEKVRYGDDEEGAQAIASLVEEAVRQAVQANPSISSEEIEVRASQRVQAEMANRAAIQNFGVRHPEIFADDVLKGATVTEMHRLAVNELQNCRQSNGAVIGQEWVQHVAAMPAIQALKVYREFRDKGWNVAPTDQISEVAAQRVEALHVQREPVDIIPEPLVQTTPAQARIMTRSQEKREMPREPRRANMTRVQRVQEPRTRSSVVEQMRGARGHLGLTRETL